MPHSRDPVAGSEFVDAFRSSAPYINAHRERTFVIVFGGDVVAGPGFASLIHDIALLNSLGVRLVLVHGARPQIEERLIQRGAEIRYVNGLRVTDDEALICVQEAVGSVRVEIEARLSMGQANTPMAGARLRVASGNFVTARPLGIRDGVDYCHTGEVRRIDSEGIRQRLNQDALVLLSPIGYSPTGQIFNLSAEEVASAAALALRADKLIALVEGVGLTNRDGELNRQLTPPEAIAALAANPELSDECRQMVNAAIQLCCKGVPRAHLISQHVDGALLLELFTRDGTGTLITADPYERIRGATIEDVGGLLELIAPFEAEGILVRRSREQLELEIDRFTLIERDGMIIACAALYPLPSEEIAELACMAVHPDYRRGGRGDQLLSQMEQRAVASGLRRLFVLTTRTAQWFEERGFQRAGIGDLPAPRLALYNYKRGSRVFIKQLATNQAAGERA